MPPVGFLAEPQHFPGACVGSRGIIEIFIDAAPCTQQGLIVDPITRLAVVVTEGIGRVVILRGVVQAVPAYPAEEILAQYVSYFALCVIRGAELARDNFIGLDRYGRLDLEVIEDAFFKLQ